MTAWERLPMFPLGSPLVPSMLLPLQVFEPRYDAMIRAVLDRDRIFGVVMIERGSEVGGGEVRTDVGCVAEIVGVEEQAPGQWGVLAVGTERLKVDTWFADDPFPVASVHVWPDEPDSSSQGPDIEGLLDVHSRLMAVLVEMRSDLVPPKMELGDDEAEIVYQLAVASPLGPLDRFRLLATPGLAERARVLAVELGELEGVLRAELES